MADETNARPQPPASPDQLRDLAEAYRVAARHLLEKASSREPLSRAPCRLSGIHAIELYLSAFLLQRGHDADAIRRMQHDLAARADLAAAYGLVLRKRTVMHLQSVSESREYLMMRYGPESIATASQINRLTATLDEIAKKVTVFLKNPNPRPVAAKSAAAADPVKQRSTGKKAGRSAQPSPPLKPPAASRPATAAT